MSTEAAIAVVASALTAIGAALGSFVSSRKSGIAEANRSLEQRVTDLERDLDDERAWSVRMALWAHDAAIQAAQQGITLPTMPTRRP